MRNGRFIHRCNAGISGWIGIRLARTPAGLQDKSATTAIKPNTKPLNSAMAGLHNKDHQRGNHANRMNTSYRLETGICPASGRSRWLSCCAYSRPVKPAGRHPCKRFPYPTALVGTFYACQSRAWNMGEQGEEDKGYRIIATGCWGNTATGKSLPVDVAAI